MKTFVSTRICIPDFVRHVLLLRNQQQHPQVGLKAGHQVEVEARRRTIYPSNSVVLRSYPYLAFADVPVNRFLCSELRFTGFTVASDDVLHTSDTYLTLLGN